MAVLSPDEITALLDPLTRIGRQRSQDRIAEVRGRIENYELQMRTYETRLGVAMLQVRQSADELREVERAADDTELAHTVEAALRRLNEHPRVAGMRLDSINNQLVITTTRDIRLTREDTGESRWLGAFEIRMGLSNGVTLHNMDTQRAGRDHPHVTEGDPCFGGHHRDFAQLQVEGRFDVLFELLVQYLETMNMADDYGSYGAYWFEVPDCDPALAEATEAVAA